MTDLIPSEDQEQTYFVQWFKRTYPDVKIYSVPNGGARHIAVAVKMKATGQSRGVPDLCIPAWRLYIEMKRVKGGKLSPEHKDGLEYLEKVGYRVIVGYGALDAQEKIIKGNYGKEN